MAIAARNKFNCFHMRTANSLKNHTYERHTHTYPWFRLERERKRRNTYRNSKTHKQSYQLLGVEEKVVRCMRRLAAAPPSAYTTLNAHAKLTPYVSWVVKRSVCGSVDILTQIRSRKKKLKKAEKKKRRELKNYLYLSKGEIPIKFSSKRGKCNVKSGKKVSKISRRKNFVFFFFLSFAFYGCLVCWFVSNFTAAASMVFRRIFFFHFDTFIRWTKLFI